MDRSLLTIPNALTFLRFLGIPLFIYLTLKLHADGWAIAVLAIGGATDYFDGKLARLWNQTSRFGELADPAIDRLYITATLIVFLIRDIVPIWIIFILLGRDFILGFLTVGLKRAGRAPLQVNFLGKAATFNLLYAFPFLLLAKSENFLGTCAFVVGWGFAIWGIALYISTGIGYAREATSQIRGARVINS
ncbi:MAG: CDP-alcohol phosphatidyltransferase family protein [Streptomycetaceae bacterium]|jgi:cardiolipin synthase|nr:MAG: CDP-alcohol phosphatidyltransferase family protein [Streptomycetaceae bacterium]